MNLLGVPRLVSPAGEVVRCEGKPLALLTYLALEGPTPRASLAELLWPDAGNAGRNNLVQLLRRMNQTYGAELCVLGPVLALSGAVRVDAQRVLKNSEPAVLHDEALAGAPLLEGTSFSEMPEVQDWLLAWRERLGALAAHQLLRRAQQLESEGDWSGAARLLHQVLEVQPLSEDVYRALMRVQYLSSDTAGARRTFERCRTILAEELQVEPMPPTLDLLRLIERGETLSQASSAPPTAPARVLPSPQLTGRETEWNRMEEAWAAGQFILLVGEPGAGKSRLAQDFLAAQGHTLALNGRPGDGAVPYATTTRALQLLLAEHPELALSASARQQLGLLIPGLREEDWREPQEGSSASLHAALQEVYTQGLQGMAGVLLDDLQFMDDASVEVNLALFLSDATRGPLGAAQGVIVSYRRGELRASMAGKLQDLLAAGRAVQIELGPLDAQAVQTLLDSLEVPDLQRQGGEPLSGRLARFTGGNPLFVLETVRQLLVHPGEDFNSATFPTAQRAEHLLSRRLERLSRTALQAARAASVLQRDFGLELVAEMLGLPLLDAAGAWEELGEAQVIVQDRFSHDLLAETVLKGIPPSVRGLLHRAAARTLAVHDSAPARVAGQWLDGGRQAEGAEWLMKAGAAAQSTYRPREAEAFYARAAALFGDLEQPDEAFLALRGQVRMLYDMEEARSRHREIVAALLLQARTPHQQAQARHAYSLALFLQNDHVEMERAVREGLAFVRDTGDLRLEAELYEALAGAMLTARRPDEARDALTRLLELSEGLGIVTWQAIAYDGLGQVAAYRSPAEALGLFQRAEALCLGIQDLPGAASGANKQARAEHKLGRFRDGLASAERGQRYLSTLDGYRIRQLINVWNRVQCAQALGEYGEALEAIDAAQQAHAVSESDWLDVLDMQRARLLLDLGQVEAARGAAARVMSSKRFSSSLFVDRLSMWALVLAAQGQTVEALAALDEAGGLLQEYGDVYLEARLRLEQATLLPAVEALPLLQAARTQARNSDLRGLELAAQVRLAQAQLSSTCRLSCRKRVPPTPW